MFSTRGVVIRIFIDLGPARLLLLPQNYFPVVTTRGQHTAVDRVSPGQLPHRPVMSAHNIVYMSSNI